MGRLVIILITLFLIDLYVFQGVKVLTSKMNTVWRLLVHSSFWIVNAGLIVWILYAVLNFTRKAGAQPNISLLAAIGILVIVPNLFVLIVMLIEDIGRLLIFGANALHGAITEGSRTVSYPGRRKFIATIAFGIASIPFAAILYGVTKGKYKFRIHKLRLRFKNLPAEFHGFRIVQLSDLHLGSFDSKENVERGFRMVTGLKPDLILFTGDMVNNVADEMKPWIESFSILKASTGMYSILGNHDYGDYVEWASREEKQLNLEKLKAIQKQAGFKLLLNEHVRIQKGDQSIVLAGVENWGLPPFPQKGDLAMASAGTVESDFRILMSHDPSHWDAQILKDRSRWDLTLSGHTHGMQFGVEIPGFKWSPVKYRYARWAGLFKENNRFLYVNRGFGYIGFPGRVGIWPEITEIILERDDD